eukprot:366458-Chlamydomonas_euryale.AAC.6
MAGKKLTKLMPWRQLLCEQQTWAMCGGGRGDGGRQLAEHAAAAAAAVAPRVRRVDGRHLHALLPGTCVNAFRCGHWEVAGVHFCIRTCVFRGPQPSHNGPASTSQSAQGAAWQCRQTCASGNPATHAPVRQSRHACTSAAIPPCMHQCDARLPFAHVLPSGTPALCSQDIALPHA